MYITSFSQPASPGGEVGAGQGCRGEARRKQGGGSQLGSFLPVSD